MTIVGPDEARRLAVRAQLLDGSARVMSTTIRHLGSLQLDPIATVAPPQQLVLWSRLGNHDVGELDRLLWSERSLFEWNAYIWPIESLPVVRGLMQRWRVSRQYKRERWVHEFLTENRPFRRYVLRELEQRGPLLSRELEDRAKGERRDHRWYGSRMVGLMLTSLHLRGEIAIAGRRGGQRLWDLAGRCYPETETIAAAAAEALLDEHRFRIAGVRRVAQGWEAHPDAVDGPIPGRVRFLSPFDRLVQDRDRAEELFGFRYRLEMYVPEAKREYGYYVLPILQGDRLIGRIEPVFDRRRSVLAVQGLWAQPGATPESGPEIARALRELAEWLGAETLAVGPRVPRMWARAVRSA